MIENSKCEDCFFATNCFVKKKLKPFSDEAKVDLGVDLNFVSCDKFTDINDVIDNNEN